MADSFITDTGIQVPAVTTAQMREIDRVAIEETGPNLFQMMENAGHSLALCAIDMLGKHWRRANVVVLAGSGGNGGGGICAARHLANRGVSVRLCLADARGLAEVPAFQLHVYQSTSGRAVTVEQLETEVTDLVIDAIIGYGLQKPPYGAAQRLIQWTNRCGVSVLALDVPSGLDSTTGEAPGEYVKPHRTLTLALPKKGFLSEKAGEIILADIGIPEGVFRTIGIDFSSPFDSRFGIPLSVHQS